MIDEHEHDDAGDAPLPPHLADLAARYHEAPPEIPREAMWSAIQIARRTPAVPTARPGATPAPAPVRVVHTTRRVWRDLATWASMVGVAALAVVAGLRVTPPATATRTSIADTDAAPSTAWQVASTEHFGLAESMLTMFATSSTAQSDRQLSEWSRDLLASTRLLMDSPAGRDGRRRALLEDLEFVLVQLVESGPTLRDADRSVVDELLSRSSLLLTRIRTTIPAGSPAQSR